MPDDPNTDYENAPLDAEDWKIVFAAYQGRHKLALILAQHLTALKEYILRDKPEEAMAAIDRAVAALFPHTGFSQVGLGLFRAAVEGRLTTEQETMIEHLTAELK